MGLGDHLPDLGAPRRHHLPGPGAGPLRTLQTTGLTKAYGRQRALQGVDLEVPPGSLYGLIGPNGSGKTTLLEILAGLRRPSGGAVGLGVPAAAVGYCPDVAEFEPWLTARELLDVALGLLGRRRPRQELDEILERVGLTRAAERRVGGFSRGMATRLNIAAALVGQPELLLVDEPASSLDPAGRAEVLRLVASLVPATTVVLSSHDLAEVEAICDRVGILSEGRLLYQGGLAELLEGAARPRWRVVVRPPAEPTGAALLDATWVSDLSEPAPGEFEISSPHPDQLEASLPGVLSACGARLVSVTQVRPTLEEVFLALTAPDLAEAEAR